MVVALAISSINKKVSTFDIQISSLACLQNEADVCQSAVVCIVFYGFRFCFVVLYDTDEVVIIDGETRTGQRRREPWW